MNLNEYQQQAMSTCMDSCDNFAYMFINLVGEMGELASKVAKAVRKNQMFFIDNQLHYDVYALSEKEAQSATEELKLEAGDILWQLSGLCKICGWTLEDVARANLEKLASRKQRGVIDGNGDFR